MSVVVFFFAKLGETIPNLSLLPLLIWSTEWLIWYMFVAKKGADEEQRLSQLKLALTWDRVDIAQEEIFREDVLWSTGKLSPLTHQIDCKKQAELL